MKTLLKLIAKKNNGTLIVLAFLTIAMGTLDLFAPYVKGKFIDYLSSKTNVEPVFHFLGLFVGSIFFRIFFNYFYTVSLAKLKTKGTFELKLEILKHLRHIPLLKFQAFEPVYLADRIDNDAKEIVEFCVTNYTTLLLQGIIFLMSFTLIAQVNKSMFLLLVIISVVYVCLYFLFKEQLHKRKFFCKEKESELAQSYNEQIFQLEEIKISANYESHNAYMQDKFQQNYVGVSQYAALESKFARLEAVMYHAAQGSLLLFGAYSILQGEMTIGNLLMLAGYLELMIDAVSYYVNVATSYQGVKVAFKRNEELLNIPLEQAGTEKLEHILTLKGKFNFRYDKERGVLENIDFGGASGHLYGLTGKNGRGKSTLFKIFVGLLPLQGKSFLRFNNCGIGHINMEHLRQEKIGYVTQQHFLTNKRVGELMQEFQPKLTLDNMECYLKHLEEEEQSMVLGFLKTFWHRRAQELSGGEKQMLAIIRVLCKEPELLLLDEPTSHLDDRRKAWFKQVLLTLRKKLLIILCSHDTDLLSLCERKIKI